MEIRQLKQVEAIARKHFKCIVKPIHEIHSKGYKGVKLIVGQKENYNYKPEVDPKNPPEKYKDNPTLLKAVTTPFEPDIRIIWLPPGMTDKELEERFLLPIKKDLNKLKEKATERKDPTLTKIQEEETDADLAAKLARGETVDSRFDEWDEGFEEEEDNMAFAPETDIAVEDPDERDMAELDTRDNLEEEKGTTEELINALNTINNNITVLSEDVGKINSRVEKLEVNNKKTKGKTNKNKK